MVGDFIYWDEKIAFDETCNWYVTIEDLYQAFKERMIKERQQKIKLSVGQESIIGGALSMTYRKHCLDDPNIGWEEVSDKLRDALCELWGDEKFCVWLDEIKKSENRV